jgi:hypothetical protein
MLEDKLKEVDTKVLEALIAKTVTDATGWQYSFGISSIKYLRTGEAEITLTLKTSDWLGESVKQG